MAESSGGLERTRRQLAEASAILGSASDRRAAAGNRQSSGLATIQRLVSRLATGVATGHPASRVQEGSQDLNHDRDLHQRLQAQRLALSLLARGLPVPQALLKQVGSTSQHQRSDPQVEPHLN